MEPVLVDDRLHRRDVEDLMALRRLVVGNDRAATPAHGLRPAIVNPVDLAFFHHRAAVALVTGLSTALLRAGPALGPVRPAGAIGRRRLGRIVRVQVDPLLQQRYLRLQLDQHRRLRLNQRVASLDICWQRQSLPRNGGRAQLDSFLRIGHRASFTDESDLCKPFLSTDLRPHWLHLASSTVIHSEGPKTGGEHVPLCE